MVGQDPWDLDNNQCRGFEGKKITVEQALGEDVDLNALLAGH